MHRIHLVGSAHTTKKLRKEYYGVDKSKNFFSCEQSKAADPKPYKAYGERSRTPLCEANGKITCP